MLISSASPAAQLAQAGTVSFGVAANTSVNQRRGTLTIAGQTFTITQSGVAQPTPTPTLPTGTRPSEWDDRFGFSGTGSLDVRAIAVSGNDIYVGGNFSEVSGVPMRNIARWDGRRWQPLGGSVGRHNSGSI